MEGLRFRPSEPGVVGVDAPLVLGAGLPEGDHELGGRSLLPIPRTSLDELLRLRENLRMGITLVQVTTGFCKERMWMEVDAG